MLQKDKIVLATKSTGRVLGTAVAAISFVSPISGLLGLLISDFLMSMIQREAKRNGGTSATALGTIKLTRFRVMYATAIGAAVCMAVNGGSPRALITNDWLQQQLPRRSASSLSGVTP